MHRPGLLILLFLSLPALAQTKSVSIRDFGAKPDANFSNSDAFARAIDELDRAGGGTLRVPKGKWETGPIELKSNITLDLEKDAVLLMKGPVGVRKKDNAPEHFPVAFTRWEGVECYNYSGLIWARGAKNIAIKGEGTIDGQGQNWWPWFKTESVAADRLRDLAQSTDRARDRVFGTPQHALRPSLIQFIDCTAVVIDGPRIRNGPHWAVHPIYCTDVTLRNLDIYSNGPSTDGIDIDSCTDVMIEKCTVESRQDCIAIKSGRDADGRRVAKPSSAVKIRECTLRGGEAGIAIGSEMSGGVEKIEVFDCRFENTARGVRIKSQRGRGGYVGNIVFEKLRMKDVRETAIVIDMQHNPLPATDYQYETTPVFYRISFKDVEVESGKSAALIRGIVEAPIETLLFDNVKFRTDKGITISRAVRSMMRRVEVWNKEGIAISLENSSRWSFDNFKPARGGRDPLIRLRHSPFMTFKGSNAPKETDVFMVLSGNTTKGVRVEDCDVSNARSPYRFEDGAKKESVQEINADF